MYLRDASADQRRRNKEAANAMAKENVLLRAKVTKLEEDMV